MEYTGAFRCAHIFIFTFNRQNVKRPTSRSTAQHMGSATCGGQRDMWCATCGGQRNMWWAVRHVVGSATCGGQRDMWWAAQHVVGSATPSAQHPQQTLSFSHSLSHGHSLSVWNTPGQGQASSKPRPPSKCLVGVLSRPSQLRVATGGCKVVGGCAVAGGHKEVGGRTAAGGCKVADSCGRKVEGSGASVGSGAAGGYKVAGSGLLAGGSGTMSSVVVEGVESRRTQAAAVLPAALLACAAVLPAALSAALLVLLALPVWKEAS